MLPKRAGNDMLPGEAGLVKAGPTFVFSLGNNWLGRLFVGHCRRWGWLRWVAGVVQVAAVEAASHLKSRFLH